MITVRTVEAKLITADNYTQLLKAVKDEMDALEGFDPKAEFLNHKQAIVYNDEIPEEPSEPWRGRYCCECVIYEWGRGCPHREGRVSLKMPACSKFTIEYEGVEE